MKTFRRLYCERHRIPEEEFERTLVWRCLNWQAKPWWWLLGLSRGYYSPDIEFVRAVGGLRRRRDFRNEAAEFHYHPRNRGFLRQVLGLRVSGDALRTLFEEEVENRRAGAQPKA